MFKRGFCIPFETWKKLLIERLPEGFYLATSEDVKGLVAQGITITETLKIARDVAKKLPETQENLFHALNTAQANELFASKSGKGWFGMGALGVSVFFGLRLYK
jgi:hypothetical protein